MTHFTARRVLSLLLVALTFSCASPESSLSAGDLRRSGSVRFPVTCSAEVEEDFQTAVALLHSFFYVEARRRFEDIAARDPDCAMAWWGIAMTRYHPLWSPPSAAEMEAGRIAVQRAQALGGPTEIEQGFIDAIAAFFATPEGPPSESQPVAMSCHGPRTHGARAEAFRNALAELHERFPDEPEVTIFYCLSLLGTAAPTDTEYSNQLRAAAVLEPLFELNPDHPGTAHYIIHALDYPILASRGLTAARRYDDIAPWVPHALHMPTHIYTRMGMWEDSIAGNLASSSAARDYAERFHDGATMMDDLHAMDYLMYGYLQTARDREAQGLVEELADIDVVAPGNEFASAYAIAAIPARYALERRQWREATQLSVLQPDLLNQFPFAVAHVEFARAVGAARIGDLSAARMATQRLGELRDSLPENFAWWDGQIEIQELAAHGWLAHATGDSDEALRLLGEAADLEDRWGTHPVTPGQLLPAREQLADLLLEVGRPEEALVQYGRSLESFPSRLNSHHGAAMAAERVGDSEAASRHARALLTMTQGQGRAEVLASARALLEK